MDPQTAETVNPSPSDLRAVENSLRGLWDRVRQAGDLISSLKEERLLLQSQVKELDARVQALTRDLQQRDEALKAMADEKSTSAANGFVVANGEREAMAERLKVLLAKIDSYL